MRRIEVVCNRLRFAVRRERLEIEQPVGIAAIDGWIVDLGFRVVPVYGARRPCAKAAPPRLRSGNDARLVAEVVPLDRKSVV